MSRDQKEDQGKKAPEKTKRRKDAFRTFWTKKIAKQSLPSKNHAATETKLKKTSRSAGSPPGARPLETAWKGDR